MPRHKNNTLYMPKQARRIAELLELLQEYNGMGSAIIAGLLEWPDSEEWAAMYEARRRYPPRRKDLLDCADFQSAEQLTECAAQCKDKIPKAAALYAELEPLKYKALMLYGAGAHPMAKSKAETALDMGATVKTFYTWEREAIQGIAVLAWENSKGR